MVDRASVSLCAILVIVSIIIITNVYTKTNSKTEDIKRLVRGIARWSNASQQDKSPLIAVLHANYSAGYLWGLLDIASDSEIKEATGINIKDLASIVVKNQDLAHMNAVKYCPEYMEGLDPYLSKLAGEGV